MPPKENDIFKDWCIGWTTREGEVIGKVKHSALSTDGFTCEIELTDIKKEKKMNKLQGKNIDKIEIRHYGDNVVAKAYRRANLTDCSGYVYDEYWSPVGEASATCGPNDIFDFNIGAKLALDRLYEGYDMTPKPKRKLYNGYVVFINTSHKNNEFCYGCVVYEVVDGLIPRFLLYNGAKDLRIEENMTCSSLKKRVEDMYFGGDAMTRWNKVMYSNLVEKNDQTKA